jgi:hypothetical protein
MVSGRGGSALSELRLLFILHLLSRPWVISEKTTIKQRPLMIKLNDLYIPLVDNEIIFSALMLPSTPI